MHTPFQLAKKYIKYYLSSSNGRGHGVHSPFVFDFIKNVLNDTTESPVFRLIEERRKALLHDHTLIEVEDHGAGSAVIATKKRKVSAIAASSLKSKKYARLLYRIIKYYKPCNVLELGTSFGITTAYMAAATQNAVCTIEGSPAISAIANETLSAAEFKNAVIITGPFSLTLGPVLSGIRLIGLSFVDGHHDKAATIRYFRDLLEHTDENSMLLFDDIHWSKGMEEAWEIIKNDPAVTMSIDLFFIGIVLLRKEFKVKQHFRIRY
jgi:predicted O-methyltransferase YrrM